MNPAENPVSRREWIGRLSVPAIAATLGAGVARGQTPPAPTADSATTRGVRTYNVRDFGAKGDGTTVDTAAFQAAIDACTADGGGTVLVPAGTFVIGTTELKSNVTLHVAASAIVLGSGDGKQYHAVEAIPLRGDSTLGDGNWALFFAVGAKNVTVEGPGTIDGQGQLFNNYGQGGKPPPSGIGGAQRPYHLLFHRCEDLVVRDLKLLRCAFHSIRVIQSERVRMEGLYIHNRVNINNDGFHFISARHVAISNCTILCQDDACALFGSCQFVTVTNCVFSTRWSVFRFGGGMVKNISVSNCLIYDTYGCPIKIGAGQTQLENVSFSNLILQNVTGPIGINFSGTSRGSDGGAAAAPAPFVRNISFHHIRASVVTQPTDTYGGDMATLGRIYDGEQNSCITLNGVGNAIIENVSFTDVHITYAGGGSAELAAKRKIPPNTREYFGVWSEAPLGPPAYGLFARNVRGLTLDNVRFEVAKPDLRPALILDHVSDVTITGLAAQGNPDAESMLRIVESRDVLISAARVLTPVPVFLRVEGAGSADITVDGGALAKAAKPLEAAAGANENAVRLRI
jgi:hypothetical protein